MNGDVVMRTVALDDDDALRVLHRVGAAAEDADHHRPVGRSFEDYCSWVRDPGMRIMLWGAWRGDGCVATGGIGLPSSANTDKAWLVTAVHPSARGQGVEAVLLSHLVDAVPASRTVLLCQVAVPPHVTGEPVSIAALQVAGWTETTREVCRELALPASGEGDGLVERMATLDAAAAPHRVGYDVHTSVNGVPVEHRAGLSLLAGQLRADAPSGDVEWDETPGSADDYERRLAQGLEAGLTRLESYALAPPAADGTREVAAITRMTVPTSPDAPASQGPTYVHRHHRGRRLGLAVKMANLRELLRRFPGCRYVTTTSDARNAPMHAINEQLGFAVTGYEAVYYLKR